MLTIELVILLITYVTSCFIHWLSVHLRYKINSELPDIRDIFITFIPVLNLVGGVFNLWLLLTYSDYTSNNIIRFFGGKRK